MKIKVLHIGNTEVGKTYLLNKYKEDIMMNISPTIGVDFTCIFKEYNDNKYKLHSWDCAGSSRFRAIIRSYYTIADIYIIYFDANDTNFTIHIEAWLNEIKSESIENNRILLVGNYKSEINFILQNEIKDYLDNLDLNYIFMSGMTDYDNIIQKIINLYESIKIIKSKDNTINSPLLNKKKRTCRECYSPCLIS